MKVTKGSISKGLEQVSLKQVCFNETRISVLSVECPCFREVNLNSSGCVCFLSPSGMEMKYLI